MLPSVHVLATHNTYASSKMSATTNMLLLVVTI